MADRRDWIALAVDFRVAPDLGETTATVLVEGGEVIVTRRLPASSIARLLELLRNREIRVLDAGPGGVSTVIDRLASMVPPDGRPGPTRRPAVPKGTPVGPRGLGWQLIAGDAEVPRG